MYISRTDNSKLVRFIWGDFERWANVRRVTMERRCEEMSKQQDAKWRATPMKSRIKQEEHEAQKTQLLRKLEEEHFSKAIEEWRKRLENHKLQDEDWGVMTDLEKHTVDKVLGGDLVEPVVAIENVVTQPHRLTVPAPTPVPPLSSAARASNTSASSYALVSPTDFNTDDELFEAVSSYIVPTDDSEDEHISIPVPIHHSEGWGISNGWGPHGRSSNHSSQTGSPDQMLSASSSSLDYFSYPSSRTKPEFNSAPPKRPPDIDKPGKVRLRGPTYVGPSLSDADETTDVEADFEKFKMETRINKIWEFHYAAAQADIELAMAIQNDRATKKSSGKADDALKVAEHEKKMLRLQATKEEERKALVSLERKKRRDEIRKRSILKDSTHTTNSMSGNHQSWHSIFDSHSVRIDIDADGKLLLRKEDSPMSGGQVEKQSWDSPPTESSSQLPAPAQIETLRGRRQPLRGATPSGWKTKHAPSSSAWHAESTAVPAPTSGSMPPTPSWLQEAENGDSPFDYAPQDSEDYEFPGGFPDDAMSTPVPPVASGWATKMGPSAAKRLAQADNTLFTIPAPPINSKSGQDTLSSPIDASLKKSSSSSAIPKPEPSPETLLPSSTKKQAKKRPINQKKGAIALSKPEEAAPATIKETPQQKLAHADEELSSTPRPHPLATHMKRSAGLTSDYSSDAASTPRAGPRRLESTLGTQGSSFGSPPQEETPWQRMQRLNAQGQAPVTKSAPSETEETIWARGMKQMTSSLGAPESLEQESLWNRPTKAQTQSLLSDPRQRLGTGNSSLRHPATTVPALGGESEGESLWEQVMKKKLQGGEIQASMKPNPPPPTVTEDETPWQRVMRLKAEAPDTTSLKATLDQANGSGSGKAPATKQPWAAPTDFDPPISKLVQQQMHSSSMRAADAYRASNGGGLKQQALNTGGYAQATSILRDPKAKKASATAKKVTIEDVPDEEGPAGQKGPEARLPSNSRVLLDIVEPKPSVPPTVFTNIFQYGEQEAEEEEEEEDYDMGLSSMVPTPSTAPTSPPSEVPSLDEDWFMSAAENMKKGNWDSLFEEGSRLATDSAAKPKQQARWASGSQMIDSAKLFSALESVDDTSPQTVPAPKPAAVVTPPAPATVEKKDTAPKPVPAVKEVKETKGKGKKGKGGRK